DYFDHHGQALVVLDDVIDLKLLDRVVAGARSLASLPCHVLVTTYQSSGGTREEIEVPLLAEADALTLLLADDALAPVRDVNHPKHEVARKICGAVGNLPLALGLAAAHLHEHPDLDDLLGALQKDPGGTGASPLD